MDKDQVPEGWLDIIELLSGRAFREPSRGSCQNGESPGRAIVSLSDSLLFHFGSIGNYERLRRIYPNGIPDAEIVRGC